MDGFQIATWLEVSHTSHDIAVITGSNQGLHHFAFWVDDWNDLRSAADACAYHGVHIETNPTRHGVSRGQCLYFFGPPAATATRCSPAATGSTRTPSRSPGPRRRWAGPVLLRRSRQPEVPHGAHMTGTGDSPPRPG